MCYHGSHAGCIVFLEPGRTYQFSVQAGNAAGPSPKSVPVFHVVARPAGESNASTSPAVAVSEGEAKANVARNTLHRAVKQYADVGCARDALADLERLQASGEAVVSDMRRLRAMVDDLAAARAEREESKLRERERRCTAKATTATLWHSLLCDHAALRRPGGCRE